MEEIALYSSPHSSIYKPNTPIIDGQVTDFCDNVVNGDCYSRTKYATEVTGNIGIAYVTHKVGTKITSLSVIVKFDRVPALRNIHARVPYFTNPKNLHHIIPNALRNNAVVQAAIRAGLKYDDVLSPTSFSNGNLIPIERFIKSNGLGTHNVGHPNYTERIETLLENFRAANPGYKDVDALEYVKEIQNGVIDAVDKKPTTKLDDLSITPKK